MEVYGRDGRKHKLSIITLPYLDVSFYVDGVYQIHSKHDKWRSDLKTICEKHGFDIGYILFTLDFGEYKGGK